MKLQKKFNSLADLDQIPGHEQKPIIAQIRRHDGKGKSVRIILDTHGRKGKSVTIVLDLQHNPATLEDIARQLKHYCGAGGTVKDMTIEIQGDQRTKVAEKLREMNYAVK